MTYLEPLLALIIIPACALLNNLGGQSTLIPKPRLTCRIIGQGLMLGVGAMIYHYPWQEVIYYAAMAIVGVAAWAVWHWGSGFMAVNDSDRRDRRDYNNYAWIAHICDEAVGVRRGSLLSWRQLRYWGACYMAIRGLFILPLFLLLGVSLMSPAGVAFGLLGGLQGTMYYYSRSVSAAEYKQGALIGFMFWLTLFAQFLAGSYGG